MFQVWMFINSQFVKLTIHTTEVIVESTSAGVDEQTITDYNNKASLGGLYPRNFRVDYLFKCLWRNKLYILLRTSRRWLREINLNTISDVAQFDSLEIEELVVVQDFVFFFQCQIVYHNYLFLLVYINCPEQAFNH